MEFVHTVEYEGYEIGFGSNGHFYLAKGSKDDVILYDSFPTLYEAEQAAHQIGIAERSTVSLDLPILLADGKEYTVRRIHSGHGTWLTTPAMPQRGASVCYKPGPGIRWLLTEWNRLSKERDRIFKRLDSRQINLAPAQFYQGEDKSETIARRYETFRNAYNAMADADEEGLSKDGN